MADDETQSQMGGGGMFGIGTALQIPTMINNISAQNKAMEAQQEALNRLRGIQNPNLKVNFEKYQDAGNYNPQLEAAFQQQHAGLNQYQANPQLMQAQLGALSQLQGIGQSGGLTINDQANLNNLMSQQAQLNKGQQGAIMQNYDARGMGNSGMALASQLNAAQESANRGNENATNIAGQAQQRALQAIQGAGQIGGAINQQQFGQAATTSAAQDAINRFNTMNQQQVAGNNVNLQNQAQQANLQKNQNLSNMNTGLGNQQQFQNNQYQQQQFQNALGLGQAIGGRATTAGNLGMANADKLSGAAGQIGQGINQYAAAQTTDANDIDANQKQKPYTNTGLTQSDF